MEQTDRVVVLFRKAEEIAGSEQRYSGLPTASKFNITKRKINRNLPRPVSGRNFHRTILWSSSSENVEFVAEESPIVEELGISRVRNFPSNEPPFSWEPSAEM